MQPLVANLTLLLQLLAQNDHHLKPKSDRLPKDLQISSVNINFQALDSQEKNGCIFNVYEDDQCKLLSASPLDNIDMSSDYQEIQNLLVAAKHNRPKRNGLRCRKWLWPHGFVPYESKLADKNIIENLQQAILEINALNCVKFEQRSNDNGKIGKFLLIEETQPVVGKSCAATAGTTAQQPKMFLSSVCTKGKILHELMHVLGFAHEHQRPDRDDFVEIGCDNVMENVTQDFRRLKNAVVDTFDEPYDFRSIMHYRIDHFSKNGKPTISPLKRKLVESGVNVTEIGAMVRLSDGDIIKIKKMYCPNTV